MSITRRIGGLAAAAIFVATLATCNPQESTRLTPTPSIPSPEIRIGLVQGAPRLALQGDSGLTILDSDGAAVGVLDPAAAWLVKPDGSGVAAGAGTGWAVSKQASLTFVPRSPGGLVSVGDRWYHGKVMVIRDRTGVTAINVVAIEEYLPGVVSAEMGRRDSNEANALAAQAIVSRTFAIRNLGKRASDGFDLLATVVDQAYVGVGSEYPLARDAVARTAGQVITWQGVPIDAFFFSTCAGRTAAGTEVFAAADRPYLVSVRDADGNGEAYCRISPRYRWREEWTADQLRGVLRQTLPAAAGTRLEEIATVQGVQVTRRSPSQRVSRVTVALGRTSVDVDGPAVRQVLHPVGETTLRSAIFELFESREDGRLTRLAAEGQGAGHGVGFCQWGAVGRSRAGQDAPTIIGAYFPGTDISRAY